MTCCSSPTATAGTASAAWITCSSEARSKSSRAPKTAAAARARPSEAAEGSGLLHHLAVDHLNVGADALAVLADRMLRRPLLVLGSEPVVEAQLASTFQSSTFERTDSPAVGPRSNFLRAASRPTSVSIH